jgi:hypothetical protein
MKMFSKMLLSTLLTLISVACFAQKIDPRQKLFAAYPETVSLDRSLMSNAFTYKKDAVVTFQFSSAFTFKGTVISSEKRYDNLEIMIIRSAEDNNSLFQLSKITNEDKSISFSGRILNSASADGYVIKNTSGSYSLQKIQSQRILEPCNL